MRRRDFIKVIAGSAAGGRSLPVMHSAVFVEVKIDAQLGVIRVTRVVNPRVSRRVLVYWSGFGSRFWGLDIHTAMM